MEKSEKKCNYVFLIEMNYHPVHVQTFYVMLDLPLNLVDLNPIASNWGQGRCIGIDYNEIVFLHLHMFGLMDK